jgi:hypothetical protein
MSTLRSTFSFAASLLEAFVCSTAHAAIWRRQVVALDGTFLGPAAVGPAVAEQARRIAVLRAGHLAPDNPVEQGRNSCLRSSWPLGLQPPCPC